MTQAEPIKVFRGQPVNLYWCRWFAPEFWETQERTAEADRKRDLAQRARERAAAVPKPE